MPKQPVATKKKAKATMASKKRKVTLTSESSDDTFSERSIHVATDSTPQSLTSGGQGDIIDSAVESSDEEGGTIDSIDMDGTVYKTWKPLTDFPQFPLLPAEIQQMIFMEAMRKPAVHFTEIKYCQDGDTRWTVTVHPVGGTTDTSMYRQLRRIGSVCPAAARAVHFGTENKHRLPFSARGLKSAGVDTRHDLVVFHLKSHTSKGVSDFGPWYPANFGASNSVLDVAHVRAMFKGITNIALKLDVSSKTGIVNCWDFNLPFRSRLRVREHALLPICPEELSGFLDLFPDLSNVYWLLATGRTNYNKSFLNAYTRCFYELGAERRQSRGLSIFHDSENAYLQLDSILAEGTIGKAFNYLHFDNSGPVAGPVRGNRLTSAVDLFSHFVKEALTADRHPTNPIPVRFQSSFKHRSGIKFAALLKVKADADWRDHAQ